MQHKDMIITIYNQHTVLEIQHLRSYYRLYHKMRYTEEFSIKSGSLICEKWCGFDVLSYTISIHFMKSFKYFSRFIGITFGYYNRCKRSIFMLDNKIYFRIINLLISKTLFMFSEIFDNFIIHKILDSDNVMKF